MNTCMKKKVAIKKNFQQDWDLMFRKSKENSLKTSIGAIDEAITDVFHDL